MPTSPTQLLEMLQSLISGGKLWLRSTHLEALDSDAQMLDQFESEITTRQDYYQVCGRW